MERQAPGKDNRLRNDDAINLQTRIEMHIQLPIYTSIMCLKYMKGMLSLNITWHSYFLIPWQSFYGKRAKSLKKFFLQLWKSVLEFIEISRNICPNTNLH